MYCGQRAADMWQMYPSVKCPLPIAHTGIQTIQRNTRSWFARSIFWSIQFLVLIICDAFHASCNDSFILKNTS